MKKVTVILVIYLLFTAGILSSHAQTTGGTATVKFGNTSEDDASINIDGSHACTVPQGEYCTSPVSAGSHTFEFVWGSDRVTASGDFNDGDYRLLCADTDGAAWVDPSQGCGD